jgi:hypothetical protein
MTEERVIRLPLDLCAAAEQNFGHRFGTLEDLLVFILRELTRNEASQADLAEQKIIEERLRDLGYI